MREYVSRAQHALSGMISPLSRLPGSTLARELIRVSVALLLQDRMQETMRFPYASPCAPLSPLLDSRPLVEAGHTMSLQPNRSAQDGACIAPGRPVSCSPPPPTSIVRAGKTPRGAARPSSPAIR